jgi:uncharacterized protein (TIGR00369 family)
MDDGREERIAAWIAGTGHLAPITEFLGVRPVDLQPGNVTVEMDVGPRFHSPLGLVHGGILVDLADVAMGCAVATLLSPDDSFVTTDLHVAYLKGVREGRLEARAFVVKDGRTTIYLEAEVRHDGHLVAKLSSTCVVRRAQGST